MVSCIFVLPAGKWEQWAPANSRSDAEVRGLLRGVMGLHSTFADEIWLWRGQADEAHRLEPGVHSRVRNTPVIALDESNARWATRQLLTLARENELDRMDGFRLPDLALLAHLQHHGAATPLLDVSVDPLVGLWMAAHASGDSADGLDDRAGLLFAIRRPDRRHWLDPLDSRRYWTVGSPDVASGLGNVVSWFRPPDVSERLRIQRGSFLLGGLVDGAAPTTLSLDYRATKPWLGARVSAVGQRGKPTTAGTSIVAFRIRKGLKKEIREWLSERAGLTQQVIYPTPWHRPFLDEFCQSYGRRRPVDHG